MSVRPQGVRWHFFQSEKFFAGFCGYFWGFSGLSKITVLRWTKLKHTPRSQSVSRVYELYENAVVCVCVHKYLLIDVAFITS